MLELGYMHSNVFTCGYRIYISGDTLMVDELKEIPERYKGQNIDLMLVHLGMRLQESTDQILFRILTCNPGGTTLPSPKMPLLMVTMDAQQGLQLLRLIDPDLTVPIHYEY